MRDPRRDERSQTTTSDVGDNGVQTRPLLAEHERLLDQRRCRVVDPERCAQKLVGVSFFLLVPYGDGATSDGQ
jgi:hypothetical protein